MGSMKKVKFKYLDQRILGILLMVGLMIGMIGCAPAVSEETQPPMETDVETQTPTGTPILHEATPTETLSKVILVLGDGVDPFIATNTQETLEVLVSDESLTLDVVNTLSPEMVSANVKMVVGVGPNLDLNNLATNSPDKAFVAINNPNATPTKNLAVIGDPVVEQAQQAFMAGYLAALISSDYKVGALVPADMDGSDLILESFVNGARFFCGICQPKHPPYNAFPRWETLALENTNSGFQPPIDTLVSSGVEVLYLPEPLNSPDVLTYLDDQGVNVVGDSKPDIVRNNWVGTITINPGSVLVDLWPELMMGPVNVQIPAPIILIDTEAGLVSEGRFRLYEEMLADLEAGLISPQTTP